jgi:Major capsid protein Gp23
MYLSETIQQKWAPVLDHPDLDKIQDPYRRAVTAVILENQERALREESGILGEATGSVNFAGTGGYGSGATAGGPVAGFDPILISLVRRSLPNLMAYDICGVQPMTGPTGLIFAMRSVYANANTNLASSDNSEALYQEANTAFGGTGTNTPLSVTVNPGANANVGNTQSFGLANTGYGFTNGTGETLSVGTTMNQMGFSIEKVTVTANTRALAATYTLELAQDLKAVHGLDAETELANILSTEILAEINREVVRTIYATSNIGAAFSATPGVFNLATSGGDTAGRWQVETYKGLIFQIEREANKIAKDTRRGKGNIIICSTDVASALAMSGLLDYQSALTNNTNLTVDDTGNTFAGTLFGRMKVYVDPYSVAGADYVVVGYKGNVAYDAGLFYCPYVPLQMVRAIDPNTFQPKIGFKTRYGLVANPFAQGLTQGLGALVNNSNQYYRKFIVSNLK